MKFATTVPWLHLCCVSLLATASFLTPVRGFAQALPNNPSQSIDPNDPNTLRPTAQSSSVLSFDGGKRLMSEAESAVSSQNYDSAVKKLQEARLVFNQLSNFYQDLTSSFSGIDNRVADSHRKKALESAQMRDESTYRLALVYRAQNKPELSVPLLVQVIKSQNPSRELGSKAYQQLLELGFADVPFERGNFKPITPAPKK